ncbi:hypothetical protein PM082_022299 [Marasmius tenuissimus]|nr:hypothetical protein PM082_022299 [Marasmius tenuissimus]
MAEELSKTLHNCARILKQMLKECHTFSKPLITQMLSELKDMKNALGKQNSLPKGERKVLIEALDAVRSLDAPIQQISIEILQLIFEFCCEDDVLYILLDKRRMSRVLASVSALWRDVALSTPSLWSSFSYKLDMEYGRHREKERNLHMTDEPA